VNEFRQALDWPIRLRDHRLRLGIAQTELARRTGLSLTAVKAYENGARHPSRDALDVIIAALGLPPEEANPIRAGAGYAINFTALFEGRYLFDLATAQDQLDRLPWPAFITNQATLVVAFNRPMAIVLDVEPETDFPDPSQRNLLGYANQPRFTDSLENFDEVVGMLIGLAKGDPRVQADPERPPPWSAGAVARFLQGDPAFIRRFLDLWEKAPPIPHRTRHVYDVRWRYRGRPPALRFIGSLSPADIWNELWWNEWIPADTDTANRLQELPFDA
jgi:transcriptional regulator with XRE-family HTH domain